MFASLSTSELEREPLGHLGMSRGDGRCACGRTLCLRSGGRFTEKGIREEPKRTGSSNHEQTYGPRVAISTGCIKDPGSARDPGPPVGQCLSEETECFADWFPGNRNRH
jgi:hypothetical protein